MESNIYTIHSAIQNIEMFSVRGMWSWERNLHSPKCVASSYIIRN